MATIGTTLQEAVQRAKRGGGRFAMNGENIWYVVDGESTVIREKDGQRMVLYEYHFNRLWVYEPPKKSAFQEFKNAQGRVCDYECDSWFKHGMKEGWNAAINRITHDSQITLLPSEVKKIEKLKEP